MFYRSKPFTVEAYEITEVGAKNTLGETLLTLADGRKLLTSAYNTRNLHDKTPRVGDYWIVNEEAIMTPDVFRRKFEAVGNYADAPADNMPQDSAA